MEMFLATSFLVKLGNAVMGYIILRLVLRQLDKVNDFSFKKWLENADDRSKAIYLAARYVGTCLFFALLLI